MSSGLWSITQQVVEQVIDAIGFLLSSWHNAVSSGIGIVDRLHKILDSLHKVDVATPAMLKARIRDGQSRPKGPSRYAGGYPPLRRDAWDIANHDLQPLKASIQAILQDLDAP